MDRKRGRKCGVHGWMKRLGPELYTSKSHTRTHRCAWLCLCFTFRYSSAVSTTENVHRITYDLEDVKRNKTLRGVIACVSSRCIPHDLLSKRWTMACVMGEEENLKTSKSRTMERSCRSAIPPKAVETIPMETDFNIPYS